MCIIHVSGVLMRTADCCRLNMGTADELAMDVLINALSTLSKEYGSSSHAQRLERFSSIPLFATLHVANQQ